MTRFISLLLSLSLIFQPVAAYAQYIPGLNLPAPGAMVNPSPAFVPVLIKGLSIDPQNPFQFEFIVDSGNSRLTTDEIKQESERLVKYFLASMTVPEGDLWVNLSPYEENRIVPEGLGQTDLGRDMLAQDYLLKQLTASMIDPQKELGKKFWERVRKLAQAKYGTTDIPMNSFNKVWILPSAATVFEKGTAAYVVESKLKVLTEEDYLALSSQPAAHPGGVDTPGVGLSAVIKDLIIPEIEKEVNFGRNFAPLRQIYNSLILAKWYKETIKETLLAKVYVDKNKIAGVDLTDKTIKDKIYAQYVAAYKKGVFSYIKEDYDAASQESIPRKYFSGGLKWQFALNRSADPAMLSGQPVGNNFRLTVEARAQEAAQSPIRAERRQLPSAPDKAMLSYNGVYVADEFAWLAKIKAQKTYFPTADLDKARNDAIRLTGAAIIPEVFIVQDDEETFGAMYSPDEERLYVQRALLKRIESVGNSADMTTRIFIYLFTRGSPRDKRKAEYEYAKAHFSELVNNLLPKPKDPAKTTTFDAVLESVRTNIVGIDLNTAALKAQLGLGQNIKFVKEDDFSFQTNAKLLLEIGENALYKIAINALNKKIDLHRHFKISTDDTEPTHPEVRAGMLAFAANPPTDAHYLIATLKAMALSETDTFFVSPTKGDFRKPALEATYETRLRMATEFFESATGGLIRVMPALPEEKGDGNGVNGEEKVLPLLKFNKGMGNLQFFYVAGADHFFSFARHEKDDNDTGAIKGQVKFAAITEGKKGNKKDFDYYVRLKAYPQLLQKLLAVEPESIPAEHRPFVKQLAESSDPLSLVKAGASFPVLDVIGKLFLLQNEVAGDKELASLDVKLFMLNTSRGDQPIDKLRDVLNFPLLFNQGANFEIAATIVRNGIAKLIKQGEFDYRLLGIMPQEYLIELFKPENRKYLYSLVRIKGLKFSEAYNFSNSVDVLFPQDPGKSEMGHQGLLADLNEKLKSISAGLDVRVERDKARDVSVVTILRNAKSILKYEYTVKNGISETADGDNTFLTNAIELTGPLTDLERARIIEAIEGYIKKYNSAKSLIERFPALAGKDVKEDELAAQNIDVLMIPGNDDPRVYEKVLDLYSRGIGKYILISGGRGRLSEAIKSVAQRNGIPVTAASEAEMIRDIMIYMAQNTMKWDPAVAARVAADLQNPEKTILETQARFTVENFALAKKLLEEKGILAEGKKPNVLYIQKPLQQLRAKGAFESVFSGTGVKGISFTVDYQQEPTALIDIVGEYFRIIANAQKKDPVTQRADWAIEKGLDSIPTGNWGLAAELFLMLNAQKQARLREILAGNADNMGLDQEKLLANFSKKDPAAGFVKTVMSGGAKHHLSDDELKVLREPDEAASFRSKRKFNEERVRGQLAKILQNLKTEEKKEEKITEIIDWVKANPDKNFKGEEVHILNVTGKDAKVVGRLDRKIAEKFGFIHETANVVLVTPDGKVLLQLRNKDNFDDHLAMYGGHLGVGESHAVAAIEEVLQETGLKDMDSEPVFIGYEGYAVEGDNNKERRSWFVKVLTDREYTQIRNKIDELGKLKATQNRQGVKAQLFEMQKKKSDGSGEVIGIYPISFDELSAAVAKPYTKRMIDSATPFEGLPVRHLTVPDKFQGKDESVDAFFTPDSLDRLLSSTGLWSKIKAVIADRAMLGESHRQRNATRHLDLSNAPYSRSYFNPSAGRKLSQAALITALVAMGGMCPSCTKPSEPYRTDFENRVIEMRKRTTPELIVILQTITNASIDRSAAAIVLGERATEESISALVDTLFTERESIIIEHIVEGLGLTRSGRAVAPLIEVMHLQNRLLVPEWAKDYLRAYAAAALQNLYKANLDVSQGYPLLLDIIRAGYDEAAWIIFVPEMTRDAFEALQTPMRENELGFKNIIFETVPRATFLDVLSLARPEDQDVLEATYLTAHPAIYVFLGDNVEEGEIAHNRDIARDIFTRAEVIDAFTRLDEMDPALLVQYLPFMARIDWHTVSVTSMEVEDVAESYRNVFMIQQSTAVKLLVQEGQYEYPDHVTGRTINANTGQLKHSFPTDPLMWMPPDIPRLQTFLNSPYQFYRDAAAHALEQIGRGNYFVDRAMLGAEDWKKGARVRHIQTQVAGTIQAVVTGARSGIVVQFDKAVPDKFGVPGANGTSAVQKYELDEVEVFVEPLTRKQPVDHAMMGAADYVPLVFAWQAPEPGVLEQVVEWAKGHPVSATLIAAATVGAVITAAYQIWSRKTVAGNLWRLKSSDADVQSNAIAALLSFGYEKEIDRLKQLLASNNLEIDRWLHRLLWDAINVSRLGYEIEIKFVEEVGHWGSTYESAMKSWMAHNDAWGWDPWMDEELKRENWVVDVPEKVEVIRGKKLTDGNYQAEDSAMLSDLTPGGIDMNKIDVDTQGQGVQIKFNDQQMQNLLNGNFGGFAPVIINIVPIPSIMPILGLKPEREEELKVSSVK